MDDFDDLDQLIADLERQDLAEAVGDVDDEAVGGLAIADWQAAFGEYIADGSIPPDVAEDLWAFLDDDDDEREILAIYDIEAGEGVYL
jgi:hypothetical protein